VGRQQALDVLTQGSILTAGLVQVRGSLRAGRLRQGREQNRFNGGQVDHG
jgi:hypothetical protein